MINLDLIFKRDFECEYDNSIIDNDENNEEVKITKANEKIFSDGIDDYYRFVNNVK